MAWKIEIDPAAERELDKLDPVIHPDDQHEQALIINARDAPFIGNASTRSRCRTPIRVP